MTGTQPDGEATFGGTVDEVSSRAQVAGEIRIGTHGCEGSRSSAITILADQRVDASIFAKFLYTRREDDQLCTVGQCHARTIDSFVAQPCTVKFMRIEINDSLLHRRVHRLEVHFQAERGGAVKALGIVADEKPAHGQAVVRSAPDDGKHVDNGQMSKKTIGCVIENVAHRIFRTTHDAFHPINRAQVMAAVYALPASRAHKNILVVIGHPDYLMRHDLADRENEIEATV